MRVSAYRVLIGCMTFVSLLLVLSACGGVGTGDPTGSGQSDDPVQLRPPALPPLGSNPATAGAAGQPPLSAPDGDGPGSTGSPAVPTDATTARPTQQTDGSTVPTDTTATRLGPQTAGSTGSSGAGALSGSTEPAEDPAPSEADDSTETNLANRRLGERPRNNPEAADLLDHWGHRRSHGLATGLELADPIPDGNGNGDGAVDDNAGGNGNGDAGGTDLRALHTAAREGGETVAPDLRDSDDVAVIGARRGVTYGRWAGGSADTLSIEFDVSRVPPEISDDPEFRAILERAGKAWSRRIADTWSTWERSAGDLKGHLSGSGLTEVRVGEDGETSAGLEIHVTVEDLSSAGKGGNSGIQQGESWEPHFGSLVLDTEFLQEEGEAEVFSTVVHEIGHVLGSWTGELDGHDAYTDTTAGTWSGPRVVAEHGGAAPFQNTSITHQRLGTEPDPLDPPYDFAHSGVCISLMAYCNDDEALPAFLPHTIDFAFLADLGLSVTEETDRPETYGLAGWTDYAAFTVSLSRELEIALADPQPHYDGALNRWQKLDVADLLRVEADVFGHRTTAAHPDDLSGTARYAGGLIGAAIERPGLPPVTGDASLTLDLGTLDGTASFTSLLVHPDGIPETFAGGALHYPFGLSDNEIVGNGAGLTLQADFYGPGHEEVAGVIHDPRAGLLGSFGATADDRPTPRGAHCHGRLPVRRGLPARFRNGSRQRLVLLPVRNAVNLRVEPLRIG